MSGIVGSSHNIRGSGVVAKLGTDGQVFTSAGAGIKQTFEAAGGGDLVKIGSHSTASNLAELKLEGFVDAAVYHKYLISFMNVIPENDAQDFALQLLDSSDNPITDTNYERLSQITYRSADGTAVGLAGGSQAGLDRWDFTSSELASDDPAEMGGNGEMWFSFNGTGWAHGHGLTHTKASNAYWYVATDYFIYEGGTAPTGIRILFDTGDVESGKLIVYGLKL